MSLMIRAEVGLDEGTGEGEVHIALLPVERYALHVAVPDAHIEGVREFGRKGARPEKERGHEGKESLHIKKLQLRVS